MPRLALEPEQEQLFEALVEAWRSIPRSQRQEFHFHRTMGPDFVRGNGFGTQVLMSDVQELVDAGLLVVSNYHSRGSGFGFYVPAEALDCYEYLRSEAGEPVEQMEAHMREYLDSERFRAAYPAAYKRWSEAVELLWGADSERELSTIGHKCREAIQEFATALVDRHRPPSVNPDKAMTRDRLSAVVEARRPDLGEARSALLDAMFDYWRAAGDVVQRQEHAGQREGQPLGWEDGRRVVFQTAVGMFETDRTL